MTWAAHNSSKRVWLIDSGGHGAERPVPPQSSGQDNESVTEISVQKDIQKAQTDAVIPFCLSIKSKRLFSERPQSDPKPCCLSDCLRSTNYFSFSFFISFHCQVSNTCEILSKTCQSHSVRSGRGLSLFNPKQDYVQKKYVEFQTEQTICSKTLELRSSLSHFPIKYRWLRNNFIFE